MATTAEEANRAAVSDQADPASDAEPVWLTMKQAADRLGVSERHAYRLVEMGRLRAHNFGAESRPLYRVDEAVLEAFIRDAQQGGPRDEPPRRQRRRPR